MVKRVSFVFVGALLLYVLAYGLIDYARTRKGGWQVTFRTDVAGIPTVAVSQPKCGINGVQFIFPDERVGLSNFTAKVVFDGPVTNVPFGRVVYFDTTFLPGSVVFDLFGHEIELLPRALRVDRREQPWQDNLVLHLRAPAHR
jgi:hypothetical protein